MRIGILHGDNLLGRELATRMAAALPDCDLHLFTPDADRVGTLVEAGAAAGFLELADADGLRRMDALVVASSAEDVGALPELAAPAAPIVVVSPSRALGGLPPLIAGVNDQAAAGGRLLHSPHAVTIAVALALQPLWDLAPRRVVITAILPVSQQDQPGIEELVEQTRALLTFKTPVPEEVLGAQLAFNLVPSVDAESVAVAEQLRSTFGGSLPFEVTLLRAGVFHGVALVVSCVFAAPVSTAAVRERLSAAPFVSASAAGGAAPGSMQAASHDDVLVTVLGEGAASDSVRLWIVIDHLVRGGAANAAELLATVLADRDAPAH
jgi:aspartate-semialdehyde dehydrogenase